MEPVPSNIYPLTTFDSFDSRKYLKDSDTNNIKSLSYFLVKTLNKLHILKVQGRSLSTESFSSRKVWVDQSKFL